MLHTVSDKHVYTQQFTALPVCTNYDMEQPMFIHYINDAEFFSVLQHDTLQIGR